MKLLLAGGAVALSACTPVAQMEPVALAQTAEAIDGGAYAEQRCASCHAIGMTDASARRDAPPLRDFFKRYPRDGLRAAFINGVHLGAADMPTFRMNEAEADRLIAYLRSVDPCVQESDDTAEMDRCFAPL